MKKGIVFALTIVLAVAGYGCCGKKATATATNNTVQSTMTTTQPQSIDGEWALTKLNGKGLPKHLSHIDLTISREESRFYGRSACNRYFGSIESISQTNIILGAIGATRMACPDLATESAYFEALRSARTFDLGDGQMLSLKNASDEIVAEFRRKEADETSPNERLHDIWAATHIDGAEVKGDQQPTLEINLSEMHASGHNGCNSYMGSIKQATSTKLVFDNLAGTLMLCHDMLIPDSFDKALASVYTYKLDELTLHMYNAQGKEVLTFKKVD